MVFGLFSRKPDPPPQQQLRTPSPSADSASRTNHSPTHHLSNRVASPAPHPPPSPSPPPLLDAATLRERVQAVPPATLHGYMLSRLNPANVDDTTTDPAAVHLLPLAEFFADLRPPPTLHCVRCHKSYFEVENNDRSCLIGHDDDSAEVERVGGAVSGYETLWGCCGRTVEGDGDMGPPDGWCYEGKHTTDAKRARFRADSTLHDDKLTSCARLRCHAPVTTYSQRPKRARTESMYMEPPSESDDVTSEERDSGVEEIVEQGEIATERTGKEGRKGTAKGKGRRSSGASIVKKPRKSKDKDDVEDGMEVDEATGNATRDSPTAASASVPKPKPKPRGRKPKSTVKPPSSAGKPPSTDDCPPPSPPKQGRPRKVAVSKEVTFISTPESASTSNPPEKEKKARPRKLGKVPSATIVPDSEGDSDGGSTVMKRNEKTVKKKRKIAGTGPVGGDS